MTKFTIALIVLNLIAAALLGHNLVTVVNASISEAIMIVSIFVICTVGIGITAWLDKDKLH